MFTNNLKICGITTPETARFCAERGVGALGVVFFRQSPRYVTPQRARSIFEDLPASSARVGVFVDTPPSELIAMAKEAALDTVQLHGHESIHEIIAAQEAGFHVVKVLKATGNKLLEAACSLPATVGILIECGTGTLPGGNGAVWDWAAAAPLAKIRPFALAGGLTPQNLAEAVRLSKASAWDVSSGVERAPGLKDHSEILHLLATAQKLESFNNTLFWKG